jgi:signal transduction histidine kinase
VTRSVTLKGLLALLQTAILAAGLVLFGALIVESFERSLRTEADDLLDARAGAVEAAVRASLQFRQESEALHNLDPDPATFNPYTAPGVLFEVWDAQGRLAVASPDLPKGGLPWSTEAQQATARGGWQLETITTDQGQRVRVLTRSVTAEDGRVIAIVRVGESLQIIDRAVHDLLSPLLVGGGLILLACIVATWLIVSRALEPLESISETAQLIALTGDVSLVVEPVGTAEARRLASSFNRMVERVSHLLEAQRQLLADTSHELRNPLTVIRTDLDLLRRQLDAETRQEVAAEAMEEAERMSRLVADLLYLTREEQAERGHREPVRLDRIAAEVVERVKQVATDHVVELRRADPVTVLGGADRLRQLLTNLVENGIRYTPAGGHVWVDVRVDGPARARLDVTDDGIGIAPEHLPRVFDRFYRVDPARGRSTGGTGLGLSIVKRVAESYGGAVSAVSEPGVGSTFSVTLPAEEVPSREGQTESAPATPETGPSSPTGPATPAAPAAAPSGRAADSRPAGTPPTTDRPAPRL